MKYINNNWTVIQQLFIEHYCFATRSKAHIMNSMKLVIPLHWLSYTKDESKHGTAFAFIFGVN